MCARHSIVVVFFCLLHVCFPSSVFRVVVVSFDVEKKQRQSREMELTSEKESCQQSRPELTFTISSQTYSLTCILSLSSIFGLPFLHRMQTSVKAKRGKVREKEAKERRGWHKFTRMENKTQKERIECKSSGRKLVRRHSDRTYLNSTTPFAFFHHE